MTARGKGWRSLRQRQAAWRTLRRGQRNGSSAMQARYVVERMLKRVGLT